MRLHQSAASLLTSVLAVFLQFDYHYSGCAKKNVSSEMFHETFIRCQWISPYFSDVFMRQIKILFTISELYLYRSFAILIQCFDA